MTIRELTESTDYLAELDEFPVERWRSSIGWIGPNGEDIVPQCDRDHAHADLIKYIPGATKYTKLIDLYQKGWNRWYKQGTNVFFMMHGGEPNTAQLKTIKKISTDLFKQTDVEQFSIEYKTPEGKYDYIEYQKPADLNQYLDEQVTEEGWKPKNKSKHAACQQRVKNRVSVWPSAYASAQVVQCYYGRKGKKKKK